MIKLRVKAKRRRCVKETKQGLPAVAIAVVRSFLSDVMRKAAEAMFSSRENQQ